jgi:hypothetical protein
VLQYDRRQGTVGRVLTVELGEGNYTALGHRAWATALTAAALGQRFGNPDGLPGRGCQATEADMQAAPLRFERHFGATVLGHAAGVDNEAIGAGPAPRPRRRPKGKLMPLDTSWPDKRAREPHGSHLREVPGWESSR